MIEFCCVRSWPAPVAVWRHHNASAVAVHSIFFPSPVGRTIEDATAVIFAATAIPLASLDRPMVTLQPHVHGVVLSGMRSSRVGEGKLIARSRTRLRKGSTAFK